jgi:hypothetical protein
MKIEEKQALEYYESHQMQIKELIMFGYLFPFPTL